MYDRDLKLKIIRLATKYPVVTVNGPKQSGKTTLSQAVFPNYTYVNLEELSLRQFAMTKPKLIANSII